MYSKIKPTISQVYSKEKQTLKESTSVRSQLPKTLLHSIILISKQTKEMYSNRGAQK